jgi:hypothetical protein
VIAFNPGEGNEHLRFERGFEPGDNHLVERRNSTLRSIHSSGIFLTLLKRFARERSLLIINNLRVHKNTSASCSCNCTDIQDQFQLCLHALADRPDNWRGVDITSTFEEDKPGRNTRLRHFSRVYNLFLQPTFISYESENKQEVRPCL